MSDEPQSKPPESHLAHCSHGCAHAPPANNPADAHAETSSMALPTGTVARRFHVTGLDCIEEVAVLKEVLGPTMGGSDKLLFNVVRGELTVLVSKDVISDRMIISRIATTGMHATPLQSEEKHSPQIESRWRFTAIVMALILFLLAILIEILQSGRFDVLWQGDIATRWLTRLLLFATIVVSTSTIWTKVWFSLRHLRLDMNSLMFVAILGALALNQWLEGATVAFLFALSLQLEAWSVGRVRIAIDRLLKNDIAKVRIIDGHGREHEVETQRVSIGTSFIVRPGERIQLDGNVFSGRGEINESLVTGESFPVYKQVGDSVFAGTINGPSTLTIRSTRRADDTQLSRIIRLVSEHQAKKGQYETWVEQFSRWYTPAVMAIAVASVAFHYLLWQTSLTTAIYNGLALLVIACPCALVISTPVSVVAALSTAARNGVLVKGGRALEIVGKLQRIAFDKTGTLTYGTPQVVDVVAFGEHNLEEVLTRFVAVTSRSEHPLAKAISAYVREKNIATPPLENFKAVPGQGAYGVWNDRTYRIGSPEYQLNYHVLSDEMNDTLSMWRKRGDSIVVLSSQDHLCGAIALQDRARPEAMRLLQDLKKRNIRSLVLLSGDHPDAVARIAGILGITDFRGGMLPQDKVEQIEAYRAQGELVGMVGDGINDAPALAAADSGIAMGAGTDVALETADIALINNDLKSLIWLVDHSRRMLTIIRQNIFVAISIKALFALLALFGTATLWGAIAADLGGSLLVIFNGLRLLAKKTTFSNTVTETPSLSNLNDEAKHEHR